MIYKFIYPYNFKKLQISVLKLIEKYGCYKWINEDYYGLSLTYNKNYNRNELYATLGNDNSTEYQNSKNFNNLTNPGKELIKYIPFKKNLIKSRISILNCDKSLEWHKDEKLKDCVRINIPIFGINNNYIQLNNEHPYKFELGYMYSWNTERYHRIYCKESGIRINLVLGYNFNK